MGEGCFEGPFDKEVTVSLIYRFSYSESNLRHHINEPVKNVDWETVEMISASATLVPTPTPEDTLPV